KRKRRKSRLSAWRASTKLAGTKSNVPLGDHVPTQPYPLWSSDPEPTLLASRDIDTNEWVFPAVAESSPLAARHVTVPVLGDGTVYSSTVIHPGPKSGLAPYAAGYVDFPGPVRIFGRLQGAVPPAIGQRCVARPDDALGYVFELLA